MRRVKCNNCGHIWNSKVEKPRCSQCWSTNIKEYQSQNNATPPGVGGSPPAINDSEIFELLKKGYNPTDIVIKLRCSSEAVEKAVEKYNRLSSFEEDIELKALEEKKESTKKTLNLLYEKAQQWNAIAEDKRKESERLDREIGEKIKKLESLNNEIEEVERQNKEMEKIINEFDEKWTKKI